MNLPECNLRICARILAAALLLAMPFPARAVLGDSAASVLTDQTRMKGTLRSIDNGTYVMHEITSHANHGTRVRLTRGNCFWSSLGGPIYARSAAASGSVLSAGKAGCRVPAAAACKTRADGHRYSRLGVPANRPYAKFSWDGLHPATAAQQCKSQRYPLRRRLREKNWPVARGIECDVDGGLRRRWRQRITSSITSVTVACSPSTILYGQTSQCSASVTGTGSFSSTVTWTASAGTISARGLFTAPSGGVVTLPVTITATSSQDTSKSGTATVTVNPSQQASNVQPIVVDAGPAPQSFTTINEAFVTVTVCIPGTSTCQTIDHVLVDTGSSGLRLLSAAGGGELNLALPQATDSSGNPLYECLAFLDGYTWGSVSTADITVAGEKASAAAVHVVIPSSSLTCATTKLCQPKSSHGKRKRGR